jgi:hypothetical protein
MDSALANTHVLRMHLMTASDSPSLKIEKEDMLLCVGVREVRKIATCISHADVPKFPKVTSEKRNGFPPY